MPLDHHPETLEFFEELQKLIPAQTEKLFDDKEFSVEKVRKLFVDIDSMRSKKYIEEESDVKREELFVPFEEVPGGIPIYYYTPSSCLSKANPTIVVYFHGGGSFAGSRDLVDFTCKTLSSKADCIFVNVEYRLAPEHKFPANINDGCAVVKWVLANRHVIGGSQASKVGISGDSAGGQISASITHLVPGLDFQVLIYPYLNGSSHDTPSYKEFKDDPQISSAGIDWMEKVTVEKKEDLLDPRYSVLLNKRFDHLPPCLFIVAHYDVIRDDSYEYSKKLTANGVQNEVFLVKRSIHGFFTNPRFFVDFCDQAYPKFVEFIRKIEG